MALVLTCKALCDKKKKRNISDFVPTQSRVCGAARSRQTLGTGNTWKGVICFILNVNHVVAPLTDIVEKADMEKKGHHFVPTTKGVVSDIHFEHE